MTTLREQATADNPAATGARPGGQTAGRNQQERLDDWPGAWGGLIDISPHLVGGFVVMTHSVALEEVS